MNNQTRVLVNCRVLLGFACMALSFSFAQSAGAAAYTWTVTLNGTVWGTGSSPSNACSNAGATIAGGLHAVKESNGSWWCKNQAGNGTWQVGRKGDSCENAGDVYNDANGECETPPPSKCEAVEGNQFDQITNEILPDVCNQGCKATLVLSIVKQTVNSKSFLSTYQHNTPGVECSAAPPPPCEGDACEDPGEADPSTEKSEECSQWNYDAEGRRLQECKKFSYETQPGVSDCKFIAGAWTCGTPKPKPSTSKNDTTTKTEVTPHPDGSTDTKTTTTTTVTKCTGVNSCSTNTTQNVNNSHTNADGSQGSSSSSCKGSGCTSGGGSGSGSGTGSGEGEGNEEGEEDGVPGPGTSLSAPTAGDFAEGIAEWDQKVATVRAELDQKMDQYSALFSGAFDLNLGQGGGRLPCYSFVVYGETAKLCLSDYEDSLINLRYVLLLVAAVVAGIIILKD
ncbi:hypothetical protein [Pseudomonas kuykendallii]|uniref:hypothetical protein n=1 Tax=Pseudomonas kuykendallii TaxID=1007099 RepID=UPI0028D232A7|nr:hypothetical protein [Pseudomonas kuykendallii]